MHKHEILSTPEAAAAISALTTPHRSAALPVFVFDACHLGVILRAVLGVGCVLAVAALYVSHSASDWLLHLAWLTSGGLPAVLLWLVLACSLKRVLHPLSRPQQYALGVLLGMLAGAYASFMLALSGPILASQWLANSLTGGLLAAVLVRYLFLRAEGQTPAETTAQLAVLQARIRPHFLFNALNSAVALVRDEPHKAERLLEDLSDLFRAALQDPRSTITLQEEVELAQRYLSIEQVRFGERLQVQWDIAPETLAVCLPPLLLQPLVENAVKHGVEPSEIGAKVTITAQIQQKKYLLIRVTNTLTSPTSPTPAVRTRQGQGMALANIERRLHLLHDVQAKFQAVQKEDLFEVEISLPSS